MIERVKVKTLGELRTAYNQIYKQAEYGEQPALYQLVWKLLDPPPREPILDVGCGAGPFLEFADSQGAQTIGIDLSDEAVKKARERGMQLLLIGQGERLPFGDGAFRRLVCLGNLEHFWDPRQGARELTRVLAADGQGVIMLPNAWYSGDLWKKLWTGQGPDHHQAIDRFASCKEWMTLLSQAGLRVLEVQRWDKGKRWKRLFPFSLAYHFLYLVQPDGATRFP